MTRYAAPGQPGAQMNYEPRYDHWIGGEYVAPALGHYFENPTPVTGETFCEVARGTAEDVERALDAAHGAAPAWGRTSAAERAGVLNRIADRMEANLEALAVAETLGERQADPGDAGRRHPAGHRPLPLLRRARSGPRRAAWPRSTTTRSPTTSTSRSAWSAQIIPWNFPILMAVWKLAPALAAGNAVVLKPAEQTPASIHYLMSLVGDLLPPGVLNIVNGFGVEAGKPLASSARVAKVAFTGETTTGRLIMQYASENLKPVTLELGGKSPNIFFDDVSAASDDFYDKALEGFTMFALNQGEVCTCPSRALIQRGHLRRLPGRRRRPHRGDRAGPPAGHRDHGRRAGLQRPAGEDPVLPGHRPGQEGAKVLTGGERAELGGELAGGYYVQPTIFEGNN